MPILRKRQIEMLAQMNGEELERFFKTLPISKTEMESLFEFVEDQLYDDKCDDTSRFAMQFMLKNSLPFPKVMAWLNANGGYCDCKIMENIEKQWRRVFPEE